MLFEKHADLAHLVERDLAKVEVAGSSPVIRSKKIQAYELGFFIIYEIYCRASHFSACPAFFIQ